MKTAIFCFQYPPGIRKVGGSKNFCCSLRSRNCTPHLQNRGAAPARYQWRL